jgi:hypothetical protein
LLEADETWGLYPHAVTRPRLCSHFCSDLKGAQRSPLARSLRRAPASAPTYMPLSLTGHRPASPAPGRRVPDARAPALCSHAWLPSPRRPPGPHEDKVRPPLSLSLVRSPATHLLLHTDDHRKQVSPLPHPPTHVIVDFRCWFSDSKLDCSVIELLGSSFISMNMIE